MPDANAIPLKLTTATLKGIGERCKIGGSVVTQSFHGLINEIRVDSHLNCQAEGIDARVGMGNVKA
jgi:hypothetical protein